MIKHTTKMFKTDANGFSTVSFANDKNISIQVVVDDNFKKMARELLK